MPPDRATIQQAWDAIAETYAASRGTDSADAQLIDGLASTLPSDARILDVGCGDGGRTLVNEVGHATVVGLDISRRQLELARENTPAARLVQADMASIPLADGSFDAITAYHAVFHVPREEHPDVYAEFARVIRPGGRVLMTVGTGRYDSTRRDWLDSGHSMYWSAPGREATAEQLEAAGFEVLWEQFVDDPLGSQALFVLAKRVGAERE